MTDKKAPGSPIANLAAHDYTSGSNDGEWLEILSPVDNKPTGIEIYVFGEDSDAMRDARNRVTKRNQTAARRGRNKRTFSDIEEEEVILAAGVTGRWRVLCDDGSYIETIPDGDQMIECSPKNARTLYTKYRFLPEQILSFANDRANFAPAS